MSIRQNIPNMISISRGVAAVALLGTSVFGVPFWVLYGWCGVSDMIDGPLARRLGAASRRGEVIDSIADLVFVMIALVKIIPAVSVPVWIWWWVAAIAVDKVVVTILISRRQGRLATFHTWSNRLTGLLLFLLPLAIQWVDIIIPASIVCTVASYAAIEPLIQDR